MKKNRTLFPRRTLALAAGLGSCVSAWAMDPPHWKPLGTPTPTTCDSCHFMHGAQGGTTLLQVAGVANSCLTCHTAGGTASTSPFVNADQALPWPGLPAGTNTYGTSHRWDASAAGHLQFIGGAATASKGSIIPAGAYSGAFPKTYTITIAGSGAVGTATFNWTATTPGGGSGAGFLTGTGAALDSGVSLRFVNATNASLSFQSGDRWNLYVRPDLRNPTNADVLAHVTNGVAACSACHDEHSEKLQPFDPLAQAYATNSSGQLISGTNRHFMRIANNSNQLCEDCHAARNVAAASSGSHPVGISFAADIKHKQPATLPLEVTSANMGCLTCHKIHHSPDNDGKILRMANTLSLCNDCHTLSDTTSAHFVTTNSATLWPGGKYGSLMPARTDPNDRGTCINCHPVHGWATNSVTPAVHYEHLLADYQENLCFTCHAATGPAAKQVQADFAKTYRHPVSNSDSLRRTGRSVECDDCHNVHKAKAGTRNYSATATASRNAITNAPALLGADGVMVDYSGLGNFVAPTPY